MQQLQFPEYQFRVKISENKTFIFDSIRKKFVVLTPEEWVRQHTIRYLITEKKYPESLLNVEKVIRINGLQKRYDIIMHYPDGRIFLIVECKSANIRINQDTFDQIARYNLVANARYLMVTNGLQHYYCSMDYEQKKYQFLPNIPVYG